MDAAVAALRADGVSEIRLWVLADNTASRRFYERYGYRPDGARDLFRVERPGGGAVDLAEVRMVLRLGSG
jgi:RimJ/RimL family protein N-acetyltransferase